MPMEPQHPPVFVQFNTFGPLLSGDDVAKVLTPIGPDVVHGDTIERNSNLARVLISIFLELPPEALTREILDRYNEITVEETHLSIVPYTRRINHRLLKPLCSARRNYARADYVASIAASGLTAEMLAILVWKMHAEKMAAKGVTPDKEDSILGDSFEGLGQSRRTEVLRAYELINEDQYQQFRRVLGERRRHLHLWDIDEESEKSSAKSAVLAVSSLFKSIADVRFIDAGNVTVNPLFSKFFEEEERRIGRR